MKTNPELLKQGDFISETQYYKIQSVSSDKITVKNERGFEFAISKPIIAEGTFSAN